MGETQKDTATASGPPGGSTLTAGGGRSSRIILASGRVVVVDRGLDFATLVRATTAG